jgi:hypothetical protein
VDEPSQQPRAAIYGRANQASAHYRPLRKGRPPPDPAAVPGRTSRAAKRANRRRFVVFLVAFLVAFTFGSLIVGVVLASPAPMAQGRPAPAREVPEPATQLPEPTDRGVPATSPTGRGRPSSSAGTTPRRPPRTARPPARGRPATSPLAGFHRCG